jgi:hypothetical protein
MKEIRGLRIDTHGFAIKRATYTVNKVNIDTVIIVQQGTA